MELKNCRMRKKDSMQNNTLIIEKNGPKEMRNAKERLNTNEYSNN